MSVQSPSDLYGLPLEQFVPQRTALVKALRADGRRDEASEVAGLRKPSVAAWAVNQLVRTQAQAMRMLFDAGDDLARTQAAAIAGRAEPGALRDAIRRQRDALSHLVQAAEGLLTSDGESLSTPTLERVSDTLRAAAIDDEARRLVRDGCLTRELSVAGLGAGSPAATPAALGPRPAAATAARGRRAEAESRAREARAVALKAARHAVAEARRAAMRAEKERAAAEVRHEDARAALEAAEDLLAAADAKHEQAGDELEQAEQALRELE